MKYIALIKLWELNKQTNNFHTQIAFIDEHTEVVPQCEWGYFLAKKGEERNYRK